MSSLRFSSNRGTSWYFSDDSTKNFVNNKNMISRISRNEDGEKIHVNKGTKVLRLVKKPFSGIPRTHRVLLLNKGTLRLEIPIISQRN